jgi:glucose-1-phosphate cytidylyltransferase
MCGGMGTRLREETEFRPKPMVDIGGRPILWHIMKIYAHFGHTEFILPLGCKGKMIRDYFVNYEFMHNDVTLELGRKDAYIQHNCHDEAGWRITLADTGQDANKGQRIKQIEKHVTDDTFMLTYGDGVAAIDINELVAFHHSHGKIATVSGVVPGARFGELQIEGDSVKSFFEKPMAAKRGRVSGGFFVFNRKVFDYLDGGVDLETVALEQLARDSQLMVYRHDAFWACMDTLRDMEYLNSLWDEGKAEWKVWGACKQ